MPLGDPRKGSPFFCGTCIVRAVDQHPIGRPYFVALSADGLQDWRRLDMAFKGFRIASYVWIDPDADETDFIQRTS